MSGSRLLQRIARVLFTLIVLAMLFLFFSNDFGLVDIHKASIVVAVGVDVTDSGYDVTAQAAVPTPAQGGGKAAYTQVTGSGTTVAEAVDDINAKTGFYPKLAFCNLIVLGESCADKDLFTVLDYFYRNDYVPLTALVGMCRGNARELLKKKPADGGMSSSAIQRAMSEELKNSANASTVNLKLLAQDRGSASAAEYMPFIESGTAAAGGGGSSEGKCSNGSKSGASSGESGKSGLGGEEQSSEFTCRTTAVFNGGKFVGVLSEEQAFALNLIRRGVRYAIVNTNSEGLNYTIGLKNTGGGAKISVNGGKGKLVITFKANANLQTSESNQAASGRSDSHLVDDNILNSVTDTVKERMRSLEAFCRENNCDLFGAAQLLRAFNYDYYKEVKDNVLSDLDIDYDIKISSVG